MNLAFDVLRAILGGGILRFPAVVPKELGAVAVEQTIHVDFGPGHWATPDLRQNRRHKPLTLPHTWSDVKLIAFANLQGRLSLE